VGVTSRKLRLEGEQSKKEGLGGLLLNCALLGGEAFSIIPPGRQDTLQRGRVKFGGQGNLGAKEGETTAVAVGNEGTRKEISQVYPHDSIHMQRGRSRKHRRMGEEKDNTVGWKQKCWRKTEENGCDRENSCSTSASRRGRGYWRAQRPCTQMKRGKGGKKLCRLEVLLLPHVVGEKKNKLGECKSSHEFSGRARGSFLESIRKKSRSDGEHNYREEISKDHDVFV